MQAGLSTTVSFQLEKTDLGVITMQRICRERHESEGNHLGKRVQNRKGGSNTEPSGTEHLGQQRNLHSTLKRAREEDQN